MPNTIDNYNDDQATRDALASVGSERTLHEFYGYFFGCMAAPKPALPSQSLPLLFDADKADFSSWKTRTTHGQPDVALELHCQMESGGDPCYLRRPTMPQPGRASNAGGRRQATIQFFIRDLTREVPENDFSDDATRCDADLEVGGIAAKYAGCTDRRSGPAC
jgi:hypothetical protein